MFLNVLWILKKKLYQVMKVVHFQEDHLVNNTTKTWPFVLIQGHDHFLSDLILVQTNQELKKWRKQSKHSFKNCSEIEIQTQVNTSLWKF
jgi:hypothetical protein